MELGLHDINKDLCLSSIEFTDSKCSGIPRKCDLCLNTRKKFHCTKCIKNGDFYHSSLFFAERFAELRNRLVRARREASRARDRCMIRLEARATRKSGNLLAEIKQKSEIALLLKSAIERHKASLSELKMRKPHASTPSPPNLTNVTLQTKLFHVQCELGSSLKELEALRKARVRQVIRYIFPDCGRVVMPISHFVSEETDDCRAMLQAYHANAEMCSAAQLIALVSHYLDIRLPFPIEFSDYGTGGGSDEERHHRLCANAATLLRVKGFPPPSHSANNILSSLADILTIDIDSRPRCTASADDAWGDWAAEWAAWTNWTDPVSERIESPDDWETLSEAEVAPARQLVSSMSLTDAAASLVSIWRGWTAK